MEKRRRGPGVIREIELANGNFISLEKVKNVKEGFPSRVVVSDAGGNTLGCWHIDTENIILMKEVFIAATDLAKEQDNNLILKLVHQMKGCTRATLESLYFSTHGCLCETPAELHLAIDELVDKDELCRVEWRIPGVPSPGKETVFSLLLPKESDIQVPDWDVYFGTR